MAKKIVAFAHFFIAYLPTWIYCLISHDSHVQNILIVFIVQANILIPTIFLLVQ